MTEPTCWACGKPYRDHLGVIGMCQRVQELEAELQKLQDAFATKMREADAVVQGLKRDRALAQIERDNLRERLDDMRHECIERDTRD